MPIKWKYYDTNRPVKDIRTNRTIISEDGTIIRFNNINKLQLKLREEITITDNTRVPVVNFSPYINFYGFLFKNDKYIMIENTVKNYSFFDIQIINNLVAELGCNENYKIYLKDNFKPLVLKYKNYYYIINPIDRKGLSLVDMIESGMINIC